ncbi:hypothetical protein AXG93_4193s1250 [Marchantia polymorpha subsp. ruderalis]|uniref:Uncharacterized protein n=1 Tax=Marchantia polymorpha subsp. ruderalis TaxID=1480154 RepID=A0A176W5J3_MARPO|nr:hypothetical protein AXG93_4193s1250 [Marchantia polymorpha subsp. ruderalis]
MSRNTRSGLEDARADSNPRQKEKERAPGPAFFLWPEVRSARFFLFVPGPPRPPSLPPSSKLEPKHTQNSHTYPRSRKRGRKNTTGLCKGKNVKAHKRLDPNGPGSSSEAVPFFRQDRGLGPKESVCPTEGRPGKKERVGELSVVRLRVVARGGPEGERNTFRHLSSGGSSGERARSRISKPMQERRLGACDDVRGEEGDVSMLRQMCMRFHWLGVHRAKSHGHDDESRAESHVLAVSSASIAGTVSQHEQQPPLSANEFLFA